MPGKPRRREPMGGSTAPNGQPSDVSPEEVSAILAVIALATPSSETDSDSRSPATCQDDEPAWRSPARMVRRAHRRGPGGWRASAAPD